MITISNLNKVFRTSRGDVHALVDASISIGDDEFFVLLGPSGSGKTTLLRCVAGLETPDSGDITIADLEAFSSERRLNLPANERSLGMVFQSYAIWPHMTVGQNVALPLTHGIRKLNRADVKSRVTEVLHSVQLDGLEERPAPLLSGGQQQRVALARALAVDPAALLMDEPLSNLDARLREEVRFQIREVAKRAGVPVLYVTHDQAEAMAVADRIGVMDQGRILQVDAPTEIYAQPANATVAGFLGSMNWFTGQVSEKGKVESPIGSIVTPHAVATGPAHIGVRPENIQIGGPGPDGRTPMVRGSPRHRSSATTASTRSASGLNRSWLVLREQLPTTSQAMRSRCISPMTWYWYFLSNKARPIPHGSRERRRTTIAAGSVGEKAPQKPAEADIEGSTSAHVPAIEEPGLLRIAMLEQQVHILDGEY